MSRGIGRGAGDFGINLFMAMKVLQGAIKPLVHDGHFKEFRELVNKNNGNSCEDKRYLCKAVVVSNQLSQWIIVDKTTNMRYYFEVDRSVVPDGVWFINGQKVYDGITNRLSRVNIRKYAALYELYKRQEAKRVSNIFRKLNLR